MDADRYSPESIKNSEKITLFKRLRTLSHERFRVEHVQMDSFIISKTDFPTLRRREGMERPEFAEDWHILFRDPADPAYLKPIFQDSDIDSTPLQERFSIPSVPNPSRPDPQIHLFQTQAAQILKTIAACNAVNQQKQPLDITPQDVNALEDTQKTLTDQLRKETRQLRKHTDNKDT